MSKEQTTNESAAIMYMFPWFLVSAIEKKVSHMRTLILATYDIVCEWLIFKNGKHNFNRMQVTLRGPHLGSAGDVTLR